MSNTKWAKPHYRDGRWVKERRRSNGVLVRRHWRNGGNVSGRQTNAGERHAGARTATGRAPMPNILVPPEHNLAALAWAIEKHRIGRTGGRTVRKSPDAAASLDAVIYRDAQGRRRRFESIPVATMTVNLPLEAQQITLATSIRFKDGPLRRYRIDTPVFCNANGSVSQVKEHTHDVDPDSVNRILDRIGNATELQTARNHNLVRQQLGSPNPERAVSQAMREMLRLNPMPQLNISRELRIQILGANYWAILRPEPAAAVAMPAK